MALTQEIDRYARRLRDHFSPTAVWPSGFAGAYLGMGGRDPVFSGPEHAALVIGPPRSGKTSSVIIPALTFWPGPAVTTSTKADIVGVTHGARSRYGTTWVFDPAGQVSSIEGTRPLKWSPLLGCASWDTAIDRAWILANSARPDPTGDGRHWTERAAAMLACLLHAAAVGGDNMSTLLGWIHSRQTPEALDRLAENKGSPIALRQLSGITETDSRELSGIWSTTDSILAAYRTQAALDAADHPNFDPEEFAASYDTVHIVAPAQRAALYAPVICALLDQIRLHKLGVHAAPMLWALDEVANIAPLPNLPSIVADAGSQGLLVLACLQDLPQARYRWGEQADGLLTLFAVTLLLPGIADPVTLKTVTTLAGEADQFHRSKSRGWRSPGTTTVTTRRLPVLPENVVAHGKEGHALHLRATHPSWLRLTPWHQTPGLTRTLKGQK